MAYSHTRLRKTLALVRILMGAMFLVLGAQKISSLEFARVQFPQFVWDATHGGAIGFYGSFLNSLGLWQSPGRSAVLVGFVELFIGIGLLLGLVVRPIALLGMAYTVNLMLATWMSPGPGQPLWRYLDGQIRHVPPFFLFLLLGIGHAGENWGLGALYHRRRHLQWEQRQRTAEVIEDRDLDAPPFAEDDEELPIPSDAMPRRTY